MKHKSVKIFYIHIMWLFFINYKQQNHRVFKFLILNAYLKSQFVFITIHINTNVVFRFNFANILFINRKFNFIIIKIISQFFILLCNSFYIFEGLRCLTWQQRKYFWSLCSCWLVLVLNFLIQLAFLHTNFLIMVYKLKCRCIETRLIQKSS